jgi:hypothetical protein
MNEDPRIEIAARPESMWFGLERSAVAGAVVGSVLVAVVVAAGSWQMGLLVGVVTAVLAFGRIKGSSLFVWIGIVTVWIADRWLVRGGRKWVGSVPLVVADPDDEDKLKEHRDVHRAVKGLKLATGAPEGRRSFGLVIDSLADTVSVTLRVSGTEFSLLEPSEQGRLVAMWGRALASMAYEGSPVVRVGWSTEAGSAEVGEHTRHVFDVADDPTSEGTLRYLELVEQIAEVSTEHRSTVTVTIGVRKVRWKPRPNGLSRQDRAIEVLDDIVRMLEEDLRGAGFVVDGRLTAAELAETFLRARRPSDGRARSAARSAGDPVPAIPAGVGPLSVENSPGHVTIDGYHHASLAVTAWPSTMVRPSWLENFIANAPPPGTDRRVTVTHVPVPPSQARRSISHQLSSLESAAEVKHAKGFRVTAGARRVMEVTRRREEALADGHQMMMVAGLVTVSAADEESLEHAVDQVQSQARQAGLETTMLWLRQPAAWAAGLPLGLGITRLEP